MFALQPLNWAESKSSTILHLPWCLERFVFSWLNRAAAEYGTSPKFTRFWFIFFFFFFKSINHYCFAVYNTRQTSVVKLSMESYDWLTERLIGCTQNAKLNFKLECLSTPTVLNYLPFPTASSKLCWKLFSFFFRFFSPGDLNLIIKLLHLSFTKLLYLSLSYTPLWVRATSVSSLYHTVPPDTHWSQVSTTKHLLNRLLTTQNT